MLLESYKNAHENLALLSTVPYIKCREQMQRIKKQEVAEFLNQERKKVKHTHRLAEVRPGKGHPPRIPHVMQC